MASKHQQTVAAVALLPLLVAQAAARADQGLYGDVSVMTPKTQTILWTAGGCAAGLAGGAGVGTWQNKQDSSVDVFSTTAAYGLVGCALGLLGTWLFVSDSTDQQYTQRIASLQTQLDQANTLLSKSGLKAAAGKTAEEAVTSPSLSLDAGWWGELAIHGMTEIPLDKLTEGSFPQSTQLRKNRAMYFSLGLSGQTQADAERQKSIPVSPYLSIFPIAGYLSEQPIIAADPKFGYLGDQFPGLECIIRTRLEERIAKEQGKPFAPKKCLGTTNSQ